MWLSALTHLVEVGFKAEATITESWQVHWGIGTDINTLKNPRVTQCETLYSGSALCWMSYNAMIHWSWNGIKEHLVLIPICSTPTMCIYSQYVWWCFLMTNHYNSQVRMETTVYNDLMSLLLSSIIFNFWLSGDILELIHQSYFLFGDMPCLFYAGQCCTF